MDHKVLLLDTVALVEAVRVRDFDEARFRCQLVGDGAWSEAESKVGNAAIGLEVALRSAERATPAVWELALEALTREVDAFLQPRRGGLLSAVHQPGGG
ncbi:hypothetical protein [Pinirhizobacter soli]|uniref:hypothetical protein n=1 Tax=Pinirhizobacter soli TaxID=2786953 RepID=UPI00202A9DE4|nr:hypothetical protein [Pinirhizobacter soli]